MPAPRPVVVSRPAVVQSDAPVAERAPEPVAAPTMPSLAREVVLVDDATAALDRGQPSNALAALAIYARETSGRGQLAEDAAAIELEATCMLHQPYDDKLADFDRRWPGSSERARVARQCQVK